MTTFEIVSMVISILSILISGIAYYKSNVTEKQSIRLPLLPVITFDYCAINQNENYVKINLIMKNNPGEIIGITMNDGNFICSQPKSFPEYVDKEKSFCVVITCLHPSKINDLSFNVEIRYRDINHNNYYVDVQRNKGETIKISLPEYIGG